MKIKLLLFASVLSLTAFAQTGRELPFQTWASTPPMGWNSWDCFGPSVTEAEVKANADYMAANLKSSGWEYVVVDIRWYVDNQTTGTYNAFANSTFVYDEFGRYMPSPTRFPSSAGGVGFKALADYVHSKGLKFGIHIMRGVPKVAVNNKLPVKGADRATAADIYSTADQCTWLGDNYTVLASKVGGQQYYNSILELYASWGVDFIKVDDLSRPYHTDEIKMLRNAIDKTGRKIVLSMSPGETPVEQYAHASKNANMWRTVDDFWDNWSQLNYQFNVCRKWAPYTAPGTWPDADMLPMGHIAIRGERGVDRRTNFTKDEQYTLMTLWSIFRSPLMFGGHLPDNDAFTNSLLTNPEVLKMHHRSVNNREWFNASDQIGWTADDPENGDKYVALFNNGDDGFISARKLIYRSGMVSRLTDKYGMNIDVALPAGTRNLFLVVNDGGDGYSCDHADWINPTVYKDNGDSLKLTTLTWQYASSGWNTVMKNKSVSGGTLNVKGVTYANGFGTHSKSIIYLYLPEGYTRFKAFGGLDIGGTSQAGGATVEFGVATEDPTLRSVDVNSAIINTGRVSRVVQKEGVKVSADISGAKKLYLVVTDAGDNISYDHADWINPAIYKDNGDSLLLTTLTPVSKTSGWGTVQTNKTVNSGVLNVNGVSYTNGFGVNSNSIIELDLPEGYTHFKALCGFDNEVLAAVSGVTMEFMAFTKNPSVKAIATMPVDLSKLGFKGDCMIRDMWAQKDTGIFAGNQFMSDVNAHGARLYRISAVKRSDDTQVSLLPSAETVKKGDTIQFKLNVKSISGTGDSITGHFVVYQNDTVVGVIPVDASGNANYLAHLPYVGTYNFVVKYSGNVLYNPQISNTFKVVVSDNTSLKKVKNTKIKVLRKQNISVVTGLNPGDTLSLYGANGMLLDNKRVESDSFVLPQNGFKIVCVQSENQLTILKSF